LGAYGDDLWSQVKVLEGYVGRYFAMPPTYEVSMMVKCYFDKPHQQADFRWNVRGLLIIGGVLLLCPLLAFGSLIFANQCDFQTSWYRFRGRVPLVPTPLGTQLMTERRTNGTPDYGTAIVAAWYYERWLTDMPSTTVAAFYQHRGDTCWQIDGAYAIGGFMLELQEPYWRCDVATEPWEDGDVDILPQAAYAQALRAVYENPPADLMLPISETVIGGRLRQIYQEQLFLLATVSLSETVIFTEVRWCEP
jgi:hypothetical protein